MLFLLHTKKTVNLSINLCTCVCVCVWLVCYLFVNEDFKLEIKYHISNGDYDDQKGKKKLNFTK